MPRETSRSKKHFFTEWLEKLQQESWQLELLISGLALFGIWESKAMLHNADYYLESNIVSPYEFYADAFMTIIWAGWIIFFVNLLIHIIIRGLWIGAIGLRYVCGDIDFDELNYSEIFRRYFKRRIGSFDDYIERLEKLSSVLFSFTFLLFFMFFSFVFANIVFGILAYALMTLFPDSNFKQGFTPMIILSLLFYVGGFLVIIDFITLGGFKKVKDKTFSRVYYWIYRFFSLISLSFIYRPLLLNFIDNSYTRRLFFMAFPYTLIILVGLKNLSFERYSFIPPLHDNKTIRSSSVSKYSIDWNNYDDLRTEHHLTFSSEEKSIQKTQIDIASLSKYQLDNSGGNVFLKYLESDSKLLKRQNDDLVAFRKNGLRHSLISSGRVRDPQFESFITEEIAAIKFMTKIVNKDTSVDLSQAPAQMTQEEIIKYKNGSTDDISTFRKDIEWKYYELERSAEEKKLEKVRRAIMANYMLILDDEDITDDVTCYFYTHPNMHEKGLLCHFAVDSLSNGIHELFVKKTFNRSDCVENCPKKMVHIPFLLSK